MDFLKHVLLFIFAAIIISSTLFCSTVQARHREKPQNTVTEEVKNDKSKVNAQAIGAGRKHLAGSFKTQINKMTNWPVKRIDKGGTLLFSDSPETVYQDGILYEDTISGKGRLYYYHVNGTEEDKKVVVMLTNTNKEKSVNFHITRSAEAGPSADYLYVGKTSQLRYFGYQIPQDIFIDKDSARILDGRTNNILVKKDELVCGIYDFETKSPVKITVMMLPLNEDPYTFMKTASVLLKDDSRLRGTFKNMDRVLQGEKRYNPENDGTVYFTIADDRDDAYLTGVDATDGSSVKNYGNYGILYYLDIPMSGMGKVHYYLQPLGGVYAGAMSVQINDAINFNVLPTPSERAFFGENLREDYYADLGVYGARDSLLFKYSPPGASNLPVKIILSPER
ncbi:copper amine oxidase [Pectinatus cerevisiiphilus]|uniref:Copper amine oxidase-like protein n=1 Tax=Pectinatus cerevisiiphilus TaxID=86956 RepID=A0A4R3K8S4_9FIRM|nr:copper amine oxidase [Pectinatus cerevisiiphilus]TCS79330.1 hypothetical protein EDC37_10797 [Pectinatus cerevisiiphilus]